MEVLDSMDATFDDLGPRFARWLAPFVADELERRGADRIAPTALADYDEGTCREFAKGLKTPVLTRAATLFAHLAQNGSVGSVRLAQDLSLASPRELPGPLTTPIKRRARKLGLKLPWMEEQSPDERTVWVD